MKPSEWIILILDRYGLHKPDGRPLYQYRINDNEFNELAKTLKLSAHIGIHNIRNMFLWDAAFVIYCSEWWRRHYSGDWGWDGVFRSIGLDYTELTNNKRNELIDTGLRRWRREVRNHNGTRKFLGTIATEGGLPLHQLSESGGWLKGVLQTVLRKHVSRGIDIPILIDSYEDAIPKSFRSPEIKQILEDITQTIVSLRKEYKLTEKDTPLEWLDQNQPRWREYFPLPIDDESGKSLLSELVDTASKVKEEDIDKNPFKLERLLVRAESPLADLAANIEMPTFVLLKSIGFDNEDGSFPTAVTFEAYELGGKVWPWCRGFLTIYKGKQAIKLSGRSLKITGSDAILEIKLRIKSMGDVFCEIDMDGGNHLDVELPWMFRTIDDKWSYMGSASQSVKDRDAIVYLPKSSTFQLRNEDSSIKELGQLITGQLVKLNGSGQCLTEDATYQLSAGIEESVLQYHLIGRRLDVDTIPGEVFIGKPELIQRNVATDAAIKIPASRLIVKAIGVDEKWKSLDQVDTGVYEIRMIDGDNNVLLRRRVGILKSDFSYKLEPDKNSVNSGIIRFSGLTNCQINVSTDSIYSKILHDSNTTNISLSANDMPPQYVSLSFLQKGHKREISLRLPFPSKGALLFDPSGKQIAFNSRLFLSDLQGYRIKLFNDVNNLGRSADIEFRLNDLGIDHNSLKDLFILKKIRLKNVVSEYSIFDWVPYIESLMSVSTTLDSFVKVSIVNQGFELFSIKIRRFENDIKARWEEGVIELDLKESRLNELAETRLAALYLNQPEQANVPLIAIKSEGVLTGAWQFEPEKRQPGPWLIYPDKNSALHFRTLLWNVGENKEENTDIELIDTLPKAVCIADQEQRQHVINNVLNMMASDLRHKSWSYIDNLWSKTSHLPAVTFDIWKLAISNTRYLACLFMTDHDDIIDKLQAELPLMWELVRIDDWVNSLELYRVKVTEIEKDQEFIKEILNRKIEKLNELGNNMESTIVILRHRVLNIDSPELVPMRMDINIFLKPQLENELQELTNRSSEHTWPVVLKDFIFNECQKMPNKIISIIQANYAYQIPVTFLPFILAWRGTSRENIEWPSNVVDVFKIKQIKDYDEKWFSTAYQFLLGWLSQQNY